MAGRDYRDRSRRGALRRRTAAFLWVSLLSALTIRADGAYDVVVYGSTPAAISAAVQATRMGKRTVVVSPETRIGGLTTGGLGQTDIGNKRAFGGLALKFYRDVAAYYRDDANWTWQKREKFKLREQGVAATSGSMWVFEPSAALKILEGWERKEGLGIVRGERLDRTPLAGAAAHRVRGVVMEGGRIVALRTESGREFRGRMFIDATYEGDLMAGAGVSYFVGREDNKTYGESLSGSQPKQGYHKFLRPVDPYVVKGDPKSGLLPHIDPSPLPPDGTGDNHVQAYCYRMCLTDVPANRIPFKKPANYCEQHYELLLRYAEAGGPILQRNQANMPNRKTDTNNHGAFSTDFIGRNYDYPDASYAERDRILAEHLTYQQGLMWTLANHPRIPKKVRDDFSRWGTCKDEFLDGFGDGWQRQLYVREARRMVGEYVMTEHNCRRKRIAPRPVGMGAYGMDSHHSRRYVDAEGHVQNEGDVQVGGGKPYSIDYGALIPKRAECGNLFVPVCLSASHIAFGSIRMEPVFFALGQAAGTAAALSIDAGCAVQDLDYAKLRARLLADGQVIDLSLVRDDSPAPGFCRLPAGADEARNWCAVAKGRVEKLTIQTVDASVAPAGGFRLLVHSGGVLVKASDDAGLAFAYRTLRKRAKIGADGSWKLPCCHLVDYPAVVAARTPSAFAATLEVGPNRAYRTIQSAADAAKPGDVVLIDPGIYREWVKPSAAGTETAPITFRARERGKAVISGADVVTGWAKRADGLWEKTMPLKDFEGTFNPFTDMLHGDWFRANGRRHPRTGLVFNGERLKFRQSVREILAARRPLGPKDCLVNLAGFTTAGRTYGGAEAAELSKSRPAWRTPYGREIGWITPGAFARFAQVRVGERIDIHYSGVREPDVPSAVIEVREGAASGPVLARVEVNGTDSWTEYGTVSVTPSKRDVTCDLCFVFTAPDPAGRIAGGYTLETDGSFGRIVAAFPGDPAAGCAEFVVRPACFYPVRRHCDYQTLDGLVLRDAGPNWAPPTAEQVGVVGTHWSRGWRIENCTIHGSGASGVTLGKYGDEWDNRAESAEGYHGTIRRAVSNGLERVGHHLVANCTIYDCQQVGICGSLGAVFSTVRDCDIHHCCWRKTFDGAEQGGIKIHGAVDFTVSRCRIHNCEGNGGIWLDWMAQGALIEDCVFHDNRWDVFFEVDHGPITVRNCTLLSGEALRANSQSVCLMNNRIYGTFTLMRDSRQTPYFTPHTVTIAKQYEHCLYGDFRVFNNAMIHPFPTKTLVKEWPMVQSGNVLVPREAWQIDGGKVKFAVEGERKRAVEAALAATVPKMAKSVVTRQAFR